MRSNIEEGSKFTFTLKLFNAKDVNEMEDNNIKLNKLIINSNNLFFIWKPN